MSRYKHILTKQQAIGASLLVLMLTLTIVFVHIIPQRPQPAVSDTDTLLLQAADSLSKHHYRPRRETVSIRLRPFDPNTADSVTLLQVGLQHWQVHNLLRYRAAGGVFRRSSDIRKLYGMTDSLYRALHPYIAIDSTLFLRTDSLRRDSLFPAHISHKRDTVIELNSADTLTLQYIRGIGRYTAVQIIRYREQLGGYYSPEQIREIHSLQGFDLDSVIPHLTADQDSIHPIDVNHSSVKRLARHPYLTFEQAKAVYTLRRNRFRLSGIEDLHTLDELTKEDLHRLRPYLSFGQ